MFESVTLQNDTLPIVISMRYVIVEYERINKWINFQNEIVDVHGWSLESVTLRNDT